MEEQNLPIPPIENGNETGTNIGKQVLAAFIFFTRLPFWRIAQVEGHYFQRVVPLWPLVGWLTGGLMSLVLWGSLRLGLMPGGAVAMALITRVLVTGALHEDGFADFCDGFGGGTTRERTLGIMKDSHIGTYGVLGLLLYYLLLWNLLTERVMLGANPLTFMVADAACKGISSTIIYFLPYARKEEEAKARVVYSKPSLSDAVVTLAASLLPLLFCWDYRYVLALPVPLFCSLLLFRLMKRRIQGYTGDCCGATFILNELMFYVALEVVVDW